VSIGAEQPTTSEWRVSLALVAAAILCLAASGGLLWWHYGGVIFNDMVSSALAWCF